MNYQIHSSELALLQEAAVYIKAHIHERLRIENIARRIHMQPQKFRTCFKQVYGVTPTGYIGAERMKAAHQLLATTDLPIKEIAVRTGYRNVKVFHRAFKNHHGYTPKSAK